MRCDSVREQLNLMLDAGRPESLRIYIVALGHLAFCRDCRRELRRLRRLRALAQGLPAPVLPADLKARVMAELAAAPEPVRSGPERVDVQRKKESRMLQRSLITTAALGAVLVAVLLNPYFHRRTLAMAAMRQALNHVNTWHLEGWKLIDNQEVPWEVWGRRTPFFYHERLGDQEILDDGQRRIFVIPSEGRTQGAVLTLPSRKDAPSNLGLSFLMGLEQQNAGGQSKPFRSDLTTETFAVEGAFTGMPESIHDVSLLTFMRGGSLPIRYEAQKRLYHVPKNAHGAYDIHILTDRDKEKEWVGGHLDAHYDVALEGEALEVAPHPDYRRIDALQEAKAQTTPRENSVAQNGLTLHAAEVVLDRQGDILIRFEGYIGNANFAEGYQGHLGKPKPFSFDTSTHLSQTQDRLGAYQFNGASQEFECADDRNRRYIEVGGLGFTVDRGIQSWLALAPLKPFLPGEPLPRQITFPIQMTVNVSEHLPELNSDQSLALVSENLQMTLDLPQQVATIDIPAYYRRYGGHEDVAAIAARGFPTSFETAALVSRADAWVDVAYKSIDKVITYEMPKHFTGSIRIDAMKHHLNPTALVQAKQDLQQMTLYAQAAMRAMPKDRERLRSNLKGPQNNLKRTLALAKQ